MVCRIFNPSAQQFTLSTEIQKILKLTIMDLEVINTPSTSWSCDPQFYQAYLDGTACDMSLSGLLSQTKECSDSLLIGNAAEDEVC